MNNPPEATKEHPTGLSQDGTQRLIQAAGAATRDVKSGPGQHQLRATTATPTCPAIATPKLAFLRHLSPNFPTRPQRTGYAGGLFSEKDRTRADAPSEQPQPAGNRHPGAGPGRGSPCHLWFIPSDRQTLTPHGLTGKAARFLQWLHDPRIQQPGLTRAWRAAALQRSST